MPMALDESISRIQNDEPLGQLTFFNKIMTGREKKTAVRKERRHYFKRLKTGADEMHSVDASHLDPESNKSTVERHFKPTGANWNWT